VDVVETNERSPADHKPLPLQLNTEFIAAPLLWLNMRRRAPAEHAVQMLNADFQDKTSAGTLGMCRIKHAQLY
jgi:hypothetical protein